MNELHTKLFYFKPWVPHVDTGRRFSVQQAGNDLMVQTPVAKLLFKKMTAEEFNRLYNQFYKSINLDLSELNFNGRNLKLDNAEIEKLYDDIILYNMYYCSVNSLPINLTEDDLRHPQTFDRVMYLLDNKYGQDSAEALALGARILRRDPEDYRASVIARRRFFDR